MSKITNSIRIQIPGTWVDAHLYFGSLLLWNPQGGVFSATLEDIYRDIHANHGDAVASLIQYAIFRNDWLASESTREIGSIPGVPEAVSKQIRSLWDGALTVSSGVVKHQVSEETGEYATDVAVYANRIFSATGSGLLEGRFNPGWSRRDSDGPDDLSVAHTLTAPVGTVAVAYEQVAASSSAGVLTARFGDNPHQNWKHHAEMRSFERAPVAAHTARFGAYSLLAYGDDPAPFLLRGKKERVEAGERRYDKTIIAGFNGPSEILDDLLTGRYPHDEWHVLGNGIGTILVKTPSGLQVLQGVKDWTSLKRVDRMSAQALSQDPAHVYSTHPLDKGFVVEHLDSLGIIDEHGYRVIKGLRPNRIRTFPASKRHKGTMALLTDEGCELVGLVGRDSLFD